MGRRIERDSMLMSVAQIMAQRGTCTRLHVGAVITRESRIISSGYVGAPKGISHCDVDNCYSDKPCSRTVHAEANAVAFAARTGVSTEGTVMYVTHSPCMECAKLIINAGVSKVIYFEAYRDDAPILYLRKAGVTCAQYK